MNRPRSIRATRLAAVACLATLGLVIGACSSAVTPSSSPSPSSPTASPSITPSVAPSVPLSGTTVTTPEAAAALVVASDPRFAGVTPKDANLIGQCCFFTATPARGGFAVTIEIGFGDCPSGCINRHHWFYSVTTNGTIHLDREDGPELPAGVGDTGGGAGGVIGIRGIASAGPVCPVVRPGDPACADRPVVGATVHVMDETGLEVATLETDATGAFVVTLPPGRYRVVPDPVSGLMGTAAPVDVTVGSALSIVELTYDTGIR
jgi:hypothetical protein